MLPASNRGQRAKVILCFRAARRRCLIGNAALLVVLAALCVALFAWLGTILALVSGGFELLALGALAPTYLRMILAGMTHNPPGQPLVIPLCDSFELCWGMHCATWCWNEVSAARHVFAENFNGLSGLEDTVWLDLPEGSIAITESAEGYELLLRQLYARKAVVPRPLLAPSWLGEE